MSWLAVGVLVLLQNLFFHVEVMSLLGFLWVGGRSGCLSDEVDVF